MTVGAADRVAVGVLSTGGGATYGSIDIDAVGVRPAVIDDVRVPRDVIEAREETDWVVVGAGLWVVDADGDAVSVG